MQRFEAVCHGEVEKVMSFSAVVMVEMIWIHAMVDKKNEDIPKGW